MLEALSIGFDQDLYNNDYVDFLVDGVEVILSRKDFKVSTAQMISLFKSLKNLKYPKSEGVTNLLIDKVI